MLEGSSHGVRRVFLTVNACRLSVDSVPHAQRLGSAWVQGLRPYGKRGTLKVCWPAKATRMRPFAEFLSGRVATVFAVLLVPLSLAPQDPPQAQVAKAERAHTGMELGAKDDTFELFQGGVQYPVDSAPVWKCIAKDGLKPPGVAAVDQFRIAIEESEKAAEEQRQSQQQGQRKNP